MSLCAACASCIGEDSVLLSFGLCADCERLRQRASMLRKRASDEASGKRAKGVVEPSWLSRLVAAAATTPAVTHASRIPLEKRAVSASFLTELFGADGLSADGCITPGQLVHGRHARGPCDFDAERDPLCIRSLTLKHDLSLIETCVHVALASGDARLTHASDGTPFFGLATDFVSYSWHCTSCGELWTSLQTADADVAATTMENDQARPSPKPGHRFYWIDMFAVTQHKGSHQAADLHFEAVIAAAVRTVAVMTPWADPAMLHRCWCLHELHCTHEAAKPLAVAMPPAEAAAFRGAVASNFGSILMTQAVCVNSKQAVASLQEDQDRIMGAIRVGCGFRELNVQVLTLLNTWLRSVAVAGGAAVDAASQRRPAREQVLDFLERFEGMKREVPLEQRCLTLL